MMQDVMQGAYQAVFFTPEMLMGKKRWRQMLLNDVYSSRLRVFVVDEAHTIKKIVSLSITVFVCLFI